MLSMSPTVTLSAQIRPESIAQKPEEGAFDGARRWERRALLLGGALIVDERIPSLIAANRSWSLDRAAGGADVIATAGHIVPALVVTYVTTRLLNRPSLASATLRVGLCYAAADALEALLKPTVGRARPYLGREPLTFQPFTSSDDFHSFPSAHVVHIASLGTAIAAEARRPWVTALASAAIVYVGAQRVYRDQHWTSDVVASGMLGVDVAHATMQWLHRDETTSR
jgi:membrane-associated phospholipid phosphatase